VIRLKLPKTNCEWNIRVGDHPWDRTELTASFQLPTGETLFNAVEVKDLDDDRYMDHVVNHLLTRMAQEVGLKMLGVKR
jgi:hypothetical protein